MAEPPHWPAWGGWSEAVPCGLASGTRCPDPALSKCQWRLAQRRVTGSAILGTVAVEEIDGDPTACSTFSTKPVPIRSRIFVAS